MNARVLEFEVFEEEMLKVGECFIFLKAPNEERQLYNRRLMRVVNCNVVRYVN